MCGICGQYYYKDDIPVTSDNIQKMMNAMVHRGPDDHGLYLNDSLGLGFRRLSIIDLAGGHQPMPDDTEKIWVIFNGEIYNFGELRKQLEGFGYRFKTRSDTEVIIYGYKQWGDDVLNHLNGMFGLAIWDENKKRLLIARDRLGIKFIYYKIKDGCLSFASEVRSLLSTNSGKVKADPMAMYLFLRYRYTPSPLSIFEGVKKLAAGTCLVVENGHVDVKRWWNFKPEPFDPQPTIGNAEEELSSLYHDSLNRHLISDVPLGLLLSGGVDSSLLLAIMKKEGKIRNTYTIGYGKEFREDELVTAAETADYFSTPNYAVQLSYEDFVTSLPKIIYALEEPVASSSIIPMYYVCQRAREDVKVALVGQGPDELFGGYSRHLGVHYGGYWRSFPSPLRKLISTTLRHVPRSESIKRGLYSLDVAERLERYIQVFSIVSRQKMDEVFNMPLLKSDPDGKIFSIWKDYEQLMEKTDEIGGLQVLELRSSLPDELLMYSDKLSMAHSLEVRVPYLDYKIVEYVERLKGSFKVRHGNRKWLHKRVSRKYLPSEIIKRKKRGFAVNVVDDWFRKSMYTKIGQHLKDDTSCIYDYLNYKGIQNLIQAHEKGVEDNHKILFSIVALEEWMRNYIDT
jgi:asparagine synthase (glutamine-hydrolysing)